MNRRFALVLAFALSGCVNHGQTGIWAHAHNEFQEVKGPPKDRCEAYRDAGPTYQQCQGLKAAATKYLRGLNTFDQVCMETTFGDDPNASGCKARGQLMDSDDNGYLIEIRDPTLDSKWKNANHQRYYFENTALIDLYLRERGYE